MKLNIEHAVKVREALEPLTHPMVSSNDATPPEHDKAVTFINSTSVAISLRRIADALEKQNKLLDALTNVHRTKR